MHASHAIITALFLASACAPNASSLTNPDSAITAADSTAIDSTETPLAPSVIMEVGDSITYGSTGATPGGYRAQLAQILPSLVAVGSIKYAGQSDSYPGHTIAQIDGKMFPDGSASDVEIYQPDTILYLAGANDLYNGSDAIDTISNYVTEVRKLRAEPGVRSVLVSNIPPRVVGTGAVASSIVFNDDVSSAIKAAGDGILFVDACSELIHPDDFVADEEHPNDAGYAKMAARWAAALEVLGARP